MTRAYPGAQLELDEVGQKQAVWNGTNDIGKEQENVLFLVNVLLDLLHCLVEFRVTIRQQGVFSLSASRHRF